MDYQRIKGTILTILLGIFIALLPQNWDYIKGDGSNILANNYESLDDNEVIKKNIEKDLQRIDHNNIPKKINILEISDNANKKFVLYVREDNHRVCITELKKEPNENYKIIRSTDTTLPVVTYQSIDGDKRTLYIGGFNQGNKVSYVQFHTKDWTQKFEVRNLNIFFTSVEIPTSVVEFRDSDFLISYDYIFLDYQNRNITQKVVSSYKDNWEIVSHD